MLSRYNVIRPLSPLWGLAPNPLSERMDRLFEEFETAFARPSASLAARGAAAPRIQLRDRGEEIVMLADLPGAKQEDIDLLIEGTTVTLKAKPAAAPVPEGYTALRRERQRAAVEWSFELPYPVDAAQASATLDRGQLLVTLPKAPEAKPRTIAVKAG